MNQEKSDTEKIIYYQEKSFCQRENCLTCNLNEGHGPFWYATMAIEGRSYRIYLGDTFIPVSRENFLQSKVFQQTHPYSEKEDVAMSSNEGGSNIKPEYLTDRIDISRIPQKETIKKKEKRIPSQEEFEFDLLSLGQEKVKANLRHLYRNLIKKYHPDQYENKMATNYWMVEINNTYQSQLQKAN